MALEAGDDLADLGGIRNLADEFHLSSEDRTHLLRSGQTRLYNRVAWTTTYLKKAGLLDDGVNESVKSRRRRRRFQGDLLSLRFRAFNPSRILDRLVHHTTFLFTPGFVVASAAVLLLAVWTTIESWIDYTTDLPRLYNLNSIPLFVLVNFLVVVGHEFAHGLTCRHFGGEVREMGFMIIYFQPALYCNVSDAWFFVERYKRMFVGFAGPYFELFLWALATLAWRLTDGDTAFNYIGLR